MISYTQVMAECEDKKVLTDLLQRAGRVGRLSMLYDMVTVRPIGAEGPPGLKLTGSVYAKVVELERIVRWVNGGAL